MTSRAESQTVDDFLHDAGVKKEVLEQAGDAKLEEDFLVALEAVAHEMPQAGDVGGTRIVLGGRFINLGDAGWALATSLAALAISNLDPTGITKVVALKQALDFFKELRPLLKKLDPGKLLICSAISSITADKKRKRDTELGATKQEIKKYFTDQENNPPDAWEDIIKSLVSDDVLQESYSEHAGPFYRVRW
jgi:hypothetical protein